MARRGENIYLRKDGRWEGRYIKGRKPDGKPIYGSVYTRKYYECREKLNYMKSLYINHSRGIKLYSNKTISEFMNYWLHGIVRPCVKESTFSNYIAIFDKWILPLLGNMRLNRVDKETIQHFVNDLCEAGLSTGTVRNIYRVLSAAMQKAQEYDYLYTNPCEGIRLPKGEKKEARLLNLKEQKQLEHAAKSDKNGFAVLLSLYTGLRIGEVCALKWSDIDLENGIIRVSRTLQRIKLFPTNTDTRTAIITGSAKSMNSFRIIPLPNCILLMFKKHKKTDRDDYVFMYKNHPLEPRILQYRFKTLLKKAKLEDINFHALRHTFATRCLEMCFDIKTLSEILGHASAKMTLDKYGHSQTEHKREVMKNLDRLFSYST